MIPADFPKPGDAATILQDLERRVPDVQHELIQLEQQRASSRELADRVLADLEAEQGDDALVGSERAARELFAVRRELLDELIQVYGRYSSQLGAKASLSLSTGFCITSHLSILTPAIISALITTGSSSASVVDIVVVFGNGS